MTTRGSDFICRQGVSFRPPLTAGRIETYLEQAHGDWARAADQAAMDIDSLITRAKGLLAPWHPLDALAWLRMTQLPHDPETYRETTSEGLLAVVELAGLLLLERDPADACVGLPSSREPAMADAAALAHPGLVADLCRDITATLQEALELAAVREIAASLARGDSRDRADYIAIRMRSREVGLRNIEYDHLHRRFLTEQLTRPGIAELVVEHCGFDIGDALAVVDTFDLRLQAALESAAQRAKAEVHAFRTSDEPRFVETRGSLGTHIDDVILAFGATVIGNRLGQRVAATAEEIAELAGRPLERVQAVLAMFSQRLRGPSYSGDSAIQDFLRGHNEWRLRPVLATEDDRYYALDTGLLLFSLREAIVGNLSQSDRGRYAKHTATWMEDTAVNALTAVLAPDKIWRNLEFIDNDGVATELDALLVCDRIAIAVEAKGVALSARARTGDTMRLKRDMARIVEETLQQADRVRDVLMHTGVIRRRGSAESIDLRHISRILPVAVTLQDVSSIAGTVVELIQTGVIAFEGTPPWLVSLHDLEVICEITAGAAELLAYLDQHERLVQLDMIGVSEELDLFLLFLHEGLWMGEFLDESGKPTLRLFLPSQTDALDAYYLYVTGHRRTPAAKPRQRWNPPKFASLLRRLERERPDGWTTAAINLQTVDAQVRKKLGGMPGWLARRAEQSGQVRDVTMIFQDARFPRSGISGVAGPPGWTRAEVERRLRTLSTVRKHTQQADTWTGIGVRADAPSAPLILVQLDEAWHPDPDMDALVQQLGVRPASEVAVSQLP